VAPIDAPTIDLNLCRTKADTWEAIAVSAPRRPETGPEAPISGTDCVALQGRMLEGVFEGSLMPVLLTVAARTGGFREGLAFDRDSSQGGSVREGL
jgi:hypothetical protein